MMQSNFANAYTDTHNQTAVVDASPHRQIALLYAKAVDRVHQAKGAMEVSNYALKAKCIGRTVDILSALQGWLDMEQGGAISDNLDALYDYMIRQLHAANIENDPAKLDEVASLLGEIRSAWDAIGPQVDG
jgi:flagellar protein FliS